MVCNHSFFVMLLMKLVCHDVEKVIVKLEKNANQLSIITKKYVTLSTHIYNIRCLTNISLNGKCYIIQILIVPNSIQLK